MKTTKLHLHWEWKAFLREELNSNNFQAIISALAIERKKNTVFPENDMIFNAFNFTTPSNIKVVILGQDPYHGKRQAHGLSFSVPNGVKIPPSL
ncbi:MAG: uracil-DNA glycosylase, partial [Flavobacteriales bacterium]